MTKKQAIVISAVNKALKIRYQVNSSGRREGGFYDAYRDTLTDFCDYAGIDGFKDGWIQDWIQDWIQNWTKSQLVAMVESWLRQVQPLVPFTVDKKERLRNFYRLSDADTADHYVQESNKAGVRGGEGRDCRRRRRYQRCRCPCP